MFLFLNCPNTLLVDFGRASWELYVIFSHLSVPTCMKLCAATKLWCKSHHLRINNYVNLKTQCELQLVSFSSSVFTDNSFPSHFFILAKAFGLRVLIHNIVFYYSKFLFEYQQPFKIQRIFLLSFSLP